MAFFTASEIWSTTSLGVPAGAARPYHWVMTTSIPDSLRVGTSGSEGTRLSELTASSLSLPPVIWPISGV